MSEREIKRARLDAVLDAHGLDELVLRDPANLSWYLSGARAHVVPMADPAILEVTVARDGEELRTSVIEAPRLLAEELRADAPPLRALTVRGPASSMPARR
jgi:Xaa-Pro aminopeptidase